ncbi:arylsulfatase [Paraburkholderia dipogonis]|uniref:Arylsulfatase n=1 Tax=Paraburkholderia dipogonis TaxID=1211383 RepID=A0A4Y8MSI0_9BURK|nr:arylsulfatase [Paraburkholderia dipogonis]TFE40263.1 arylsulfatase [Paraburkholderia dipogonis]
MRISFLHTMDGNRQVFEQAAETLGLRAEDLHHEVRADLREAVDRTKAFTDELRAQTNQRLLALAADSDAVILTCATLGPAVADIKSPPVPIVRADVALAAATAEVGGRIVVLCAAESAIEATRKLFAEHAGKSAASVEVVHVGHVWALFKAGDIRACLAATASSADAAYEAGATVVAFAHPWMAAAAGLVQKGRRPLDSPSAALHAATQRFNERSRHA